MRLILFQFFQPLTKLISHHNESKSHCQGVKLPDLERGSPQGWVKHQTRKTGTALGCAWGVCCSSCFCFNDPNLFGIGCSYFIW